MARPGFEPTTSRSRSGCSATEPQGRLSPANIPKICYWQMSVTSEFSVSLQVTDAVWGPISKLTLNTEYFFLLFINNKKSESRIYITHFLLIFGNDVCVWLMKQLSEKKYSQYDIRIGTKYQNLTFKILFWHSNSGRMWFFDIRNLMLTFELGSNIELWHSKSYFDIPTGAGYHTLTFGILFWYSNWDRISDFDIRNPFFDIRIR